jgi:hypothetical protein
MDVFWHSSAGSGLWEAVWSVTGNRWVGPNPVPSVTTALSSPSIVVNTARDEEDVSYEGVDQKVWEITWSGSWSTAHAVGMGPLGSAPSATSWPSATRDPAGQQDVFWHGGPGNNGIWGADWSPSVKHWVGPDEVPGLSNALSSPSVVVNATRDEEDIVYEGSNKQLWEVVWAGNWSGPTQIGMGPLGT